MSRYDSKQYKTKLQIHIQMKTCKCCGSMTARILQDTLYVHAMMLYIYLNSTPLRMYVVGTLRTYERVITMDYLDQTY